MNCFLTLVFLFYLNKTGDSVVIVCVIIYLNTVSKNLQIAADSWSTDIGYKEIKHNEWGYTDKIKFKRRKIQPTLERHQRIERNNAQVN